MRANKFLASFVAVLVLTTTFTAGYASGRGQLDLFANKAAVIRTSVGESTKSFRDLVTQMSVDDRTALDREVPGLSDALSDLADYLDIAYLNLDILNGLVGGTMETEDASDIVNAYKEDKKNK